MLKLLEKQNELRRVESRKHLSASYLIASNFFLKLCKELEYHSRSHKYLNADESRVLLTYYPKYRSTNAYYYGHIYAKKIEAGLSFILNSKQPLCVLDAGCGVGTEALLFSVCGANVVGVDLNDKRIRVAKARARYYEDYYGKKLNLHFVLKNIMKYHGDHRFDLIWTNEFISHVHPVEDFLETAWENLKPGGWLIICDDNHANPYVRINTWLVHRKEGLYTTVPDPDTMKPVRYAKERLFTVASMTQLLKRNRFRVSLAKHLNYVPISPFYIFEPLKFFERAIEKAPILKTIAVNYAIAGKKM